MEDFYHILKEHYGYSSFRANQEQIINSCIEKKDTVALLPTGGGKSICFQVPGLFFEGITIVISPLISLMEDQVLNLNRKNISANYIHSGLSRIEIANILDKCEFGGVKFLYVSPERATSRDFIERSKQFNISLIAIDEAHCISQWGYDFRPSYLKIIQFLEHHQNSAKIALTATAKPEVVEDICKQLHFNSPQIFKSSFARSNLSYHTVNVKNKDIILSKTLKKFKGSTIVYCSTRKAVKELCKQLQLQGFSADIYHGGLNTNQRKEKQKKWIQDQTRIMVATNAFGMGIDKPDVRLVFHYNIPENIENYFQEAGRAGRDLNESMAILAYEEQDKLNLEENFKRKHIEPSLIQEIYDRILAENRIAYDSGEMSKFEFDIVKFSKKHKFDLLQVYNSLHFLEKCNYLEYSKKDETESKIMFRSDPETIYQFQIRNPSYDVFLRYLARSYPGIFDQHIHFKIEDFIKHLKTSYRRILEQLEYLEKHELIDYNLKSDQPTIQLLQNRVRKNNLLLQNYYQLKSQAEQNLVQIKTFLLNDTCRSKFLRDYFGDNTTELCGKCSFCSQKSKNQINEVILANIPPKGIDFHLLVEKIDANEEDIINTIEFLLRENKIIRDPSQFNYIRKN